MIVDNPEFDGTDGAHPAYWRGHDQAVAGLCQRITEILDGKLVVGVCAEPWETIRQRLVALVTAVGSHEK